MKTYTSSGTTILGYSKTLILETDLKTKDLRNKHSLIYKEVYTGTDSLSCSIMVLS